MAAPKPSHRMHRPIYYAHCARAKRMRAFERVTVIGAKGCWTTTLSTIFSCLLTPTQHRLEFNRVFTTHFKKIHDEKIKSVSHIKHHLIIMEIMVLRFRFAYVLLFRFSLKQSMINFIMMFPGFDSGNA